MREYQEETNRQLNFENLPVPPKGVSFPEYFTMMMELTRENQTQVSSKFFSLSCRTESQTTKFQNCDVRELYLD